MATEKVAVTIERSVLAEVEALRERTGESRSAVVARALRSLLREEERRSQVREYVEAYRRIPETPAEAERITRVAAETLSGLEWEDTE